MKRFLVIAVVALALPVAAIGKGASEATIEGPGLDGAVVIPGDGEGGGTLLGRIVELSGFFPAVFERTPNPMLAEPPGIELGPRYTVRYVMPGPEGQESILEQHLYPYAEPYPVSYTKPGQPFFQGMRTFGGWYQGTPELKQALTEIGIPAQAPGTGDTGGLGGWQIALLAVGGAMALALMAGIGRRRRAPAPA
jgi:hypothetical protein